MNTAHTHRVVLPEAATANALRQQAGQAETDGRLTAGQLETIYRNKWFKMFVPNALGGLGLSLPEGVRLEEELAWIDGSLGWTVTLCAGANLFVGYIEPAVAGLVFADANVCFGGSGQPSGTATVKGGGYEVTGRWRYATGAPHNTHFTANCVIEHNGKPVLDKTGQPLIKSFFFDRSAVQIHADWNTVGLRATASHSFEVNRLRVNQDRSFLISPEQARLDMPLYQYPFLPFAQTTLAANTLGMARYFIACCRDLPATGRKPGITGDSFAKQIEAAAGKIAMARALFYEALDRSWEVLIRTGRLPDAIQERVGETSRALVQTAQAAVVALYPYCGIAGADVATPINRAWRDIFTASQHSLLR